MIYSMATEHTTGLTAKSSTRSSKTFTREIGNMAKGMGLAVSFIPMDAGMRGILKTTRRMAKGWSWMRMETLSWNTLRRISSCILFRKVIWRC
jgi:hypothetical protein